MGGGRRYRTADLRRTIGKERVSRDVTLGRVSPWLPFPLPRRMDQTSHTNSLGTRFHLARSSGRLISERVEKYRPSILDDIVGNSDTISRLKVIAKDGNVPHLIISVRASIGIYLRGLISIVERECRESEKQRASTVWRISCWETRTKRVCWN
jgi:hypothetical protein